MSITAESILKSITVGKPVQFHRCRLQAICAAITQSVHINLILDQVGRDRRFQRATRKILAFRTEEEEGFDDCGEVGAGEKLLHMLEKMGVENILLIVCVWDDGIIGEAGGEIHAALAERARDVLNIVRDQVMGKSGQSKKQKEAMLLTASLPDPNRLLKHDRAVYRPAHFMSDVEPTQRQEASPEPRADEEDYLAGLKKVEGALQMINVPELQQLRLPPHHPQVTRVLQAVCLLRGARVPTWGAIKEFLESRTLKIELTFLDIGKLRRSQVKMTRDLLAKPPKLRMDALAQVSVQAANLLSWVEGIITVYHGRRFLQPAGEEIKASQNVLSLPHPHASKREVVEEEDASEEQLDKILTSVHKLESPKPKKKLDPEIEQKLNQARKLEKDQEERIERLLSLRLEDINFSEKATGLGEELIREMSQSTISEQPTSVLLSLVSKLKEKRDSYMQ